MREVLDAASNDHFVLWHDLEAERHAIAAAVPSAVAVYGSQDDQDQEKAILGFSDGAFQYLAAKPVMLGAGCNLQRHCHKAIFLGIGFKFADFIQAIHRLQRFLQSKPVEIHVIYAETEREILRTLQRKWRQHNDMVAKMGEIIKKFGLSEAAMAKALARSIGCERIEVSGEHHRLVNADCMEETATMEADSVDLIVTSIPFSHQYEYTPSYNDFGHTDDDAHFWGQMDHLTPELLRVLRRAGWRRSTSRTGSRPAASTGSASRPSARSPTTASATSASTASPSSAARPSSPTSSRENNQTYRLGWTEQCKDGSRMGCGVPEYLLLFRKAPTDRSNGYADVPVVKAKKTWDGEAWDNPEGYSRARWQVDAHGFSRSSGDRLLTVEELQGFAADQIYKAWRKHSLEAVYSFEHHVRIGEGWRRAGCCPDLHAAAAAFLAPGGVVGHHPDADHEHVAGGQGSGGPFMPPAVRHRRPGDRAVLDAGRDGVRSLRRPDDRAGAGAQGAPQGGRDRAQPPLLPRRLRLRRGGGTRDRDAEPLRHPRRGRGPAAGGRMTAPAALMASREPSGRGGAAAPAPPARRASPCAAPGCRPGAGSPSTPHGLRLDRRPLRPGRAAAREAPALLVKASPRPVSRDRAIELIFKGRRVGDRAEYFRRILHETRAVLTPLGATILYVPNPEGSDLPGHLSLIEATAEPRRRP